VVIRSERTRIADSFGRQASEYDRYAQVQKRVIRQMLQMVASHAAQAPAAILDVGCGTGELLSLLHDRYGSAELAGVDLAENMLVQARERLGEGALLVAGDAEDLPFGDATFDLVVSTSTLQWLDTLTHFLDQAYRVMQPGGMLCAAFFAGSTLAELHDCYRKVMETHTVMPEQQPGRLHRFHTFDEVMAVLQESRFEQVVVSAEQETEYYSDLKDLLRSIKRIGAGGSALAGHSRAGLGWRGILNEMSQQYRELHARDGKIPANYEVFYLVARK